MNNNSEDISKDTSILTLTNSLFEVGLGIVVLLVMTISIAVSLHWLSWDVSFHIVVQILFGLVIGGTAILFALPRIQLVFGKTNSLTKGVNIFLLLLGLVLLSSLSTLLSILWPTPEMSFFEKFSSNLGFVSGIILSLRMDRSHNRLH